MLVNAESSSAVQRFTSGRLARIFQPTPATLLEITDPQEIAREYRRWQKRVLVSSIIGYATFYFVRKNLSIAMPAKRTVNKVVFDFNLLPPPAILLRPSNRGKGWTLNTAVLQTGSGVPWPSELLFKMINARI
jgi:hypothetical protein